MASITLTYTTAQSNLLQKAVGVELSLGRDATPAETKAWIADQPKNLARRYELTVHDASFSPTDMTAT